MKKKSFSVITCLIAAVMLLTMVGCGPKEDGGSVSSSGVQSGKTVAAVELESGPDKTEYYLGEEFSLDGAKISVSYDDGTSEVLDLPAEGYDITEPDMTRVGEKTITVTNAAARQRVTFKISVMAQGFSVTFDPNYEGAEPTVTPVTKNQAVSEPAAPERAGHTFHKWFTDADCTVVYDFALPVTADLTLYAEWKEDGVEYCDVTFDLNYYGVAPQTYPQIVKSGDAATALSFIPVRDEFTFQGWTTDPAGGGAFDPAAAITESTTVYAKWEKTKTAASTYIFEAEQTNLKGKTGPGFSGSAMEDGMIVTGSSASGGKAVSYLYKNGNSLEFYIASDSDVTDAKLSVSIAAEMDNINFDSNEFQVIVNGTALTYDNVVLANGADFADTIVISGVSLNTGANTIQLVVNNTKRPMGDGSTYAATAPMVDCIKIETAAVLIWDAVEGLPMSY